MLETLQALAGFALIGGLFVAYFLERRARARRARAAAEPAPVVAVAPVVANESAEPRPASTSPAWAMPIIFCALLIGADRHRGSWWGYLWQVIYLAIVGLSLYSTFSPKELAAEQRRRPGTTRGDQFIKLGVPYALIPIVSWVLVIPFGWTPATLLPAVPWALLLVAGVAVGAGDFLRRSR